MSSRRIPGFVGAGLACWLLWIGVAAGAAETAGSESTAEVDGNRASNQASNYVCWALPEVLDDLRQRVGLPLVWSSHLVHEEMRVTSPEPRQEGEPFEQWLGKLLAPFDLGLRTTRDGGSWLVVPKSSRSAKSSPSVESSEDIEALLPRWLDRSNPPESRRFPGDWQPLPQGTTHLVVQVATLEAGADRQQLAFELKKRIVDAGSQAKSWAVDLQVALEGSPADLEALTEEGLAPYIHGYVYRDSAFIPSADTTGRSWLRSHIGEPAEMLSTLLAAADRGDQWVIFDRLTADAEHRAFLSRLMVTAAANLSTQPAVQGIEPERARFFIDPETGDFYLAVYAHPDGNELKFDLAEAGEVQQIFPRQQALSVIRYGKQLNLVVGGEPYQLFWLKAYGLTADHRDVDVASTRLVDPYEEVVKNQVFQRKQREKFESLDVMEYLSSVPQYAGGDRVTWEHRILQRKGKYSEYHHLGFRINGASYPGHKLLKGRLFRTESLIQFQPLEVELDETFAYRYLGETEINGRPTYRIAFDPLPIEGVSRKHRVSGEVWLDQKNHAHHRLRTYQEGLDGMVVFMDRTYDYEWIYDDGQCFWDWRRRRGSYVGTSLGQQYAVSSETTREDFDYNRPDIDQVAREAYDSDLMIHVEVPPEGHRWLVKEHGTRRFERKPNRWDPYPADGLVSPRAQEIVNADRAASAGPSAHAADSSNPRVLADIHSFGMRAGFWMGGYGSDTSDEVDFYPGLLFSHSDLFRRGYTGSLSLFEQFGRVSFGNPALFGSSVAFTTSAEIDFDRATATDGFTDENGIYRNLNVRSLHHSLRFALAKALGRRWSLNTSYTLRDLDFEPAENADPAFIMPTSTSEHVVEVEVVFRRPRLQLSLGLEVGERSDWQPWGLNGQEPLEPSYSVARVMVETFHPLPKDRMLGAAAAYIRGEDLDRFSRRPGGRSRAGLVGFPDGFSFDEGLFSSVDLGFSIAGRFPVGFQVDAAQSRFHGQSDWDARAGVSFRFLVHGPFKTDLWPSIRTGIYSSVSDDDIGKLSYGLVIRRSY